MRERDRIGGYVVRGDRAPMRCLRTAFQGLVYSETGPRFLWAWSVGGA